jgi:hypothetical protein
VILTRVREQPPTALADGTRSHQACGCGGVQGGGGVCQQRSQRRHGARGPVPLLRGE